LKIHFFVALVLLPFLFVSSEILKIAIAPYLLWMLFQKDFKYIPALFLYSATGTTISFLILVGCLIIAILNYRKYLTIQTRVLFILSLIPLPIMIFNVGQRFFILQQSFLEVVPFTFYYLGLFPFFYSLLIKNVKINVLYNYIFVISLLTVILQYLFFKDLVFLGTVYLAIPFFVAHLFLYRSLRRIGYSIYLFYIAVFVSFLGLTGIISLTTGLLFSALIASLIAAYYQFRSRLSLLIPGILIFVTFSIVIFAISTFDDSKVIQSESKSLETDLNILDINSIVSRAKFKLLEDRAPLWSAAFIKFVNNGSLWPVKSNEDLIYGIQSFDSYYEVDLAAHNLYLELVRNYGIIAGIVISISYLSMIFKGFLPLTRGFENSKIVILSSLVISIGIYSTMGGQFPLMGFFSFIFMGLAGYMYKQSYK